MYIKHMDAATVQHLLQMDAATQKKLSILAELTTHIKRTII